MGAELLTTAGENRHTHLPNLTDLCNMDMQAEPLSPIIADTLNPA